MSLMPVSIFFLAARVAYSSSVIWAANFSTSASIALISASYAFCLAKICALLL